MAALVVPPLLLGHHLPGAHQGCPELRQGLLLPGSLPLRGAHYPAHPWISAARRGQRNPLLRYSAVGQASRPIGKIIARERML